ncbi:MAG TPA: SPOR domain-containing protein [Bacteroidales bacterium]|nr:SPOR domain-containing protein [Bacteroidales bacterium]
MKRPVVWVIGLLLLIRGAFPLMAQEVPGDSTHPGMVADPRVSVLVNKHIQVNQSVKTIPGFRVQIFSESGVNSKNKAQAALEEFRGRFPEVGAYLSFKSPNYKVRVGDFRTRLEAQRFLIDLTAEYPNAFIITDPINLQKTDP